MLMPLEEFRFGRGQRSALAATRRRSNVMVVTGPTVGVGKTYVAANLAGINARAGKRVLLIDADLRHGRVASLFGLSPGAGLAHVLSGRTDIKTALRSVDVRGLQVMTAGGELADPSELLSNARLPEMLRQLTPHYDVIFIDTPAILAFADAITVAALGGSTILVAPPGPQSDDDLEDAVNVLQRTGANVAGVIYNAPPRRAGDDRRRAYPTGYAARRRRSPAAF